MGLRGEVNRQGIPQRVRLKEEKGEAFSRFSLQPLGCSCKAECSRNEGTERNHRTLGETRGLTIFASFQ